jgi:hypothetical protein
VMNASAFLLTYMSIPWKKSMKKGSRRRVSGTRALQLISNFDGRCSVSFIWPWRMGVASLLNSRHVRRTSSRIRGRMKVIEDPGTSDHHSSIPASSRSRTCRLASIYMQS